MLRQELIAKRYIEEELGISGLDVYTTNLFSIKLRGEDITVKAYRPSSETSIKMINKNGKIISYDVEND